MIKKVVDLDLRSFMERSELTDKEPEVSDIPKIPGPKNGITKNPSFHTFHSEFSTSQSSTVRCAKLILTLFCKPCKVAENDYYSLKTWTHH